MLFSLMEQSATDGARPVVHRGFRNHEVTMTTVEMISEQLKSLPEPVQREVLGLCEFSEVTSTDVRISSG